jgi:hypothetical protein
LTVAWPTVCSVSASPRSIINAQSAAGSWPTSARARRVGRHILILNVADQIADDFHLIGIIVRDFHAGELIFDQHHQFKTIEPVSPKIVTEVRFIRDMLDIDLQMLGNKRADLIAFKTFFAGRRSLS